MHAWIRLKPKLLWLLVRLGKLVEKILLVWFSQHLGVPEQQRRHTFGCSGKQEKYPHRETKMSGSGKEKKTEKGGAKARNVKEMEE